MPRPRKYPQELIDRGVRLAIESGRPVAHVAEIGLPAETLRKRVRQAEADQGLRPGLPSCEEREEIKALKREVAELRKANEILRAASVFFATELDGGRDEASAFIDRHRDRFGVELICRTLGVSASAYYQRATGERSARGLEDERLMVKIGKIFAENYECYGVGGRTPRWSATASGSARSGRPVDGCCGPAWREATREAVADHDQRSCRAQAPRSRRAGFHRGRAGPSVGGDFTYLRTWEGRVYFSFIIDVYSRMIVGWQLATHMRTDLVLDALRMALSTRQLGADFTLISHSDQGSQYVSEDYTQGPGRRARAGVGRVGRRCL